MIITQARGAHVAIAMPRTDRTVTERQRRLRERKREAGLVRVEVRVRAEHAELVRAYAQRLNRRRAAQTVNDGP